MSRSWSHPASRISAIAAVRRSISRPNVALMPMRTCSRLHCDGSDDRALEHPVGVGAQQGAIFEGSGFAFGGVDDDGDHVARWPRGGHGFPLGAGREACAPSSTQAR